MLEAQTKFVLVVRGAVNTFHSPRNKKKLRDLRASFWGALTALDIGCIEEDWEKLCKSFREAYRYLGAPGDFGYDTPCGKSLCAVYDAWNELCDAQKLVQPDKDSSSKSGITKD